MCGCTPSHTITGWSGDISAVRATDSWSKGRGFEERRENFLLRINFVCWLLFWYPFNPPPPSPPTVTRTRSLSFCQKCRWQVTAEDTGALRMWLCIGWCCKLVHYCMVYTERAPKRQQLHVAPDMTQPNSVVSTPLRWILKSALQKVYSHSFKTTCNKSAVSLLESGEYRYIKKISSQILLHELFN